MSAPDTVAPRTTAPTVRPLPRVLHLRSSCGLYGAEGVIRGLARAYAGARRVLCLADARDPHTELSDALAAEGLDAGALPSRGMVDPGLVFRLASILRAYRPDVVHTHDYKTDAVAWLGSRLVFPRPRLVATMHGVVRTSAALRTYEKLDARVLRRFDAVVAVSDGTADIARSYGIRGERIHLVSNGVDTEAFRPGNRAEARRALGLPVDGALVGVVGRLSAEKGQDVLLDAFASVGAGVRLAVVGDGPETDALQQAAGPNVRFLGRREDMARVYAALDLLALPSRTEGLPLTLLEAAACGVPAVATRVGDVAKVVVPGETGYLVPPGDPEALAAALNAALADASRLSDMGRAARSRVETLFSQSAMNEAYTRLYNVVARRTTT